MIIDTRKTDSAVYLIDERFPTTIKHPVPSGWDCDKRGAKDPLKKGWGRGNLLETRDDGKYPLIMSRRFMPLRSGKASFVQITDITLGDGYFMEFFDLDEKSVFCLCQKNGMLTLGEKELAPFASGKTYSVGIEFDIDSKSALISLDGKSLGTYPLNTDSLARYKTGYKAGSVGNARLVRTILNINYIVCDKNYVFSDSPLPYTWVNQCKNDDDACTKYYHEGQGFFTYYMKANKKDTAKVTRPFKKTSGNICFEMKYLTVKEQGEDVRISLLCENMCVITLSDNGTELLSDDGSVLRKHHPYVWQTLRVETDTNNGKATVKLNGKKCGSIDIDKNACFDGLSIEYKPDYDGYMRFTHVLVYPILPQPEDYPKPPVLPKKKEDIVTGMNICSLWRTGSHWGWDPISNFHDNHTYLGFYDEGITEVADWEIKWMAEHGLDCEFYCWYANQKTAPMFDTHLCDALHDGHFHAKYGDKVKFAIIWEAMNCVHPENVEQFKKYYIPLWIDYYFSDERYFRIDNVAIMAVFGLNNLIKDFGSEENVKACFDALREEVKKLGYRDLAVIANVTPNAKSKNSGIDAAYTYNWGHDSYSGNYNIRRIKAQLASSDNGKYGHVVPTLAVGYNDVAWRVDRYPMMTCEDMGRVLDWMKTDVLGSYKDKDEAWKRKLMMLATWNEYGEGTYICPANLNGFGYLNELRKAVTENGDAFESDRPSQKVLDRLGYLHPKGRTLLYTPQLVPVEIPDKELFEIRIDSEEEFKKWKFDNANAIFKDGKMLGQAIAFDPKMEIEVDIDASQIAAVEIMLRSAEGSMDLSNVEPQQSPWTIFFATEDDPVYTEDKKLAKAPHGRNGAGVATSSNVPTWRGKITKLRIDPSENVGSFEFEYLKFLTWDKIPPATFIDGTEYKSHYASKIEGNEAYVIFEAQRDFHLLANLYFEWDNDERTLMIECDGKVSYWTENSDTVIIDGEKVKLDKPLEFFDNLPYLPLSTFSKATGYKYAVSDNRIDIMTK